MESDVEQRVNVSEEVSGATVFYNFIVAIDLGTKYSGYAFEQKDQSKPDGTNIQSFVDWGGGAIYNNYKTPTCILLDARGNFLAFGQEAIEQYQDFGSEEQKDVLFFDLFKMTLYTEIRKSGGALDMNYLLTAKNNTTFPALEVFTATLHHFKDHFVGMAKTKFGFELGYSDVLWVVTVPAIWENSAKNFMRKAANKAGLYRGEDYDRFILALEPEAASLHCRTLNASCFCASSTDCSAPSVGDKYLVVDAGGGTVDITAHELLEDGYVRELEKATGGAYGGSQVDEQFVRLLCALFDGDFIKQLQKEEAAEFLNLMQSFEYGKRRCTFSDCINNSADVNFKESVINVQFPYDFCELYKKRTGEPPREAIRKRSPDGITWKGGLRIASKSAALLFQQVISAIVSIVEQLVEMKSLAGLRLIYLVGGFSDCPLLRDRVMTTFPHVRVLVPLDAGLAVMKGAVLFARRPSIITERVMRHTYGTEYWPDFDERIHPLERKTMAHGQYHCRDCFYPLVHMGDSVKFGQEMTHNFHPINIMSNQFVVELFVSPHREVNYITDPDCKKIAEITLLLPPHQDDGKRPRPCAIKVNFSGTELIVTAMDFLSGREKRLHIDFVKS